MLVGRTVVTTYHPNQSFTIDDITLETVMDLPAYGHMTRGMSIDAYFLKTKQISLQHKRWPCAVQQGGLVRHFGKKKRYSFPLMKHCNYYPLELLRLV